MPSPPVTAMSAVAPPRRVQGFGDVHERDGGGDGEA